MYPENVETWTERNVREIRSLLDDTPDSGKLDILRELIEWKKEYELSEKRKNLNALFQELLPKLDEYEMRDIHEMLREWE